MKYFCVFFLVATACLVPDANAADFTSGQAPRLVIGQPNFSQGNSGASSTLLGAPAGVAFANDTLFVADANAFGATPMNNRVLVYRNLSGTLPPLTGSVPGNGSTCPACVGTANVVLGQSDFTSTTIAVTQTGLRTPTAVASDGTVLAVADTNNNRILIWKSIPAANDTPADVVVGQPDFTKNKVGVPPNEKSIRGPQGVWIQNGKLFVADTQNNRVLIFNSIPNSNGASADVVLGQKDFKTFVEPDISKATVPAQANTILSPTSVTSDGQRLYVSDLGHNRILIWNSIPTQNQAAADVSVGQPDLVTSVNNNSAALCPATGTLDANGKATYPARCEATLSFPRFALSDGTRLFIADGGNDRVLIYSTVPAASGAKANFVIGQPNVNADVSTADADSFATPSSLAWDGTNLFVTDTFNRRIVAYSPGTANVPVNGIRNAASREIFAIGAVTLGGTLTKDNTVTVSIAGKDYKYTVVKDDTFINVVTSLVNLINASPGDPNVIALTNAFSQGLILTARKGGPDGTSVKYSVATSTSATVTAKTLGANLTINLADAAKIAPGTLISIAGTNLADTTAIADFSQQYLPTQLGGAELYIDGMRAPLLYVSPTQINAQLPFEVQDRSSASAYVRTIHKDGTSTVSTAVAISIVSANPGIFAEDGSDPRPGLVYHAYGNASGVIAVDGTIKAGDIATVVVNGRTYTHTVAATDTLASVRDALVTAINADPDVSATPQNVFTRILLQARTSGAAGNGIAYSASVNSGAVLVVSAFSAKLCCASTANARVTTDNPAAPGEVLYIYATGLGETNPPDGANTGKIFSGPQNPPAVPVDSILAGGKTANIISTAFVPGTVGLYQIFFQLSSAATTDPQTQLTIAQQNFVSNIVTFPVATP